MSLQDNSTYPSRILLLSQHFSPNAGATAQLTFDLAMQFHSCGYHVHVLTSSTPPSALPFKVTNLDLPFSENQSILSKALSGISFFISSLFFLLFTPLSGSRLLIFSNPPFIGLVGVFIFLVKRIKYVFVCQDIFPRSASLSGVLPAIGPLYLFWKSVLRATFLFADTTVVLSLDMIRRLKLDFGDIGKVVSIPNWSVVKPSNQKKNLTNLSHVHNLSNRFVVQYSGNLGRLHDIITILESARILADRNIVFLFIGTGPKTRYVSSYKTRFNLSNIILAAYQPRDQLPDSLAACDVSLVSLIPGAEDTVAPSKIYGSLASSRPLILIGSENCSLAKLLSESCAGLVVPAGDPLVLSEYIVKLSTDPDLLRRMQRSSLDLYRKHFGIGQSAASYLELLN